VAALARVWVNIGTFHQEWIRHFNLMVGLTPQTPFPVARAQQNSVYYQVTEARSVNLARYLARASVPIRLEDAVWTDGYGKRHTGAEFIDARLAARGRIVFAENCFVCHSSKQPDGFWAEPSNYPRWVADEAYRAWARAEVVKPDFRDGNFFSTDARHPVTLIGTNAGRAFGDNAIGGNVWADYSSETFKNLPRIGEILVHHPYTGETYAWESRTRIGPGYYRPFSLVGIWATAPFLHNQSVGRYPPGHDPKRDEAADLSVPGRLAVFEDSITKMLWPERRDGLASISRTTTDSRLRLPYGQLRGVLESQAGFRPPFLFTGRPWALPLLLGLAGALLAWRLPKGKWRLLAIPVFLAAIGIYAVDHALHVRGALEVGHIPAGTPVALLANLNGPGTIGDREHRRLMRAALGDLRKVAARRLPSLDDPEVPDLVDTLLRANKSPDFVEDRGHLFGTGLPDDDKRALIEFLKTL
jgi:hypothetical protein